MSVAKTRPAETSGTLGAAAVAVAYAAGASVDTIAAVGVVAGLVPAAVTFLSANGGVRGVARRLWAGR